MTNNLPVPLSPRLESLIVWDIYTPVGADGQFDLPRVVGAKILPGTSRADLEAMMRAAEAAMRPAGPVAALKALAKLKAVARNKPGEQVDEEVALSVYGEMLGKYPADVVAAVCQTQLETSPWFPAVSELIASCDVAMRRRKALHAALVSALSGQGALEAPKPFVREAEEVRVRGARDSFRKIGKIHRAAPYEIILAKLEAREPEAWAFEITAAPEQPALELQAETPKLSPEMEARTLRSIAKVHRAQGRADYALMLERQANQLEHAPPQRNGEAA